MARSYDRRQNAPQMSEDVGAVVRPDLVADLSRTARRLRQEARATRRRQLEAEAVDEWTQRQAHAAARALDDAAALLEHAARLPLQDDPLVLDGDDDATAQLASWEAVDERRRG